jgi:hypothetical protein
MTPVSLSGPHMPGITGGTAAQRALLRQIVRAQATTQILRLVLSPAGRAWRPDRPTDVLLTAKLAGDHRHAPTNMVGDWEAWVVGGTFRARSAELGLPRVLVVGDDADTEEVTGGADPPARPASGLPAFRRRVTAAAAGSGARIVAIRAADPDGYTALVALQVPDPATFLRHRLPRLSARLGALHADGTFVLLYERTGRVLYAAGTAARVPFSLGGSSDPRYTTCVSSRRGAPQPFLTLAPPLPCPSTWRPPPSTPPRPPKLAGGDELAGAVAAGGSGHGGSMVPYAPGTTGAIQFVLENPNGHPITIESIDPAVAPGLPIRFTGVRIQVPRSRADTGAATLRKPYGPEPPMRPVTIRPGDWVGLGLHFAVARACTAALAGKLIATDRTFVVTYVLQGRTLRHTIPSVQLNLICPR